MFRRSPYIPPEAEKILDGTCSYAESAAHERAKGRYNVSGRARDTHTLRGGGALARPAPLHTFKQTERCIHLTEQAFPLRHRGGSYKQRRFATVCERVWGCLGRAQRA